MPEPKDKELYEKVKKEVYKQYKTASAYRSGALVKKYKEEFKNKYGNESPYIGQKENQGLTRWFKEEWRDINPFKTATSYPVYRPTRRINKNTPLTVTEIKPSEIIEKSLIKQKIKNKRLSPFVI